MSAAEFYKAKLDLISWINQLSDTNMVSYLEGIKESYKNKDWWDELSENEKLEIEKGISDVENGRVLTSGEFWKKLKGDE